MEKLKLGIVGGCGSSGTTLFAHLISRHPDVVSGPEFNCFNHYEIFDYSLLRNKYRSMFSGHCGPNGYIDVHVFMTYRKYYGIDIAHLKRWVEKSTNTYSFFTYICEHMTNRFRASYFVEKSPSNVYSFKDLSSALPEVPLIHIIRDGRDVVSSLMKRNFSLFSAGSAWLYDTLSGIRARGAKNYLEIRYEDLVSDPVGTLRTVFDHLQLLYDSNIVDKDDENLPGIYVENWLDRKEPRAWKQTPSDPISTASIGRYKDDLDERDLSTLYRIRLTRLAASKLQVDTCSFAELLQLLGYSPDRSQNKEKTEYRRNIKELRYELDDYYRRVGRFTHNRYYRLPHRYTYIDV